MNLTDNEVLKFQCGCPVFIEDVCAIYPATLKQIVELGYDKFQQYLSILTATKPIEHQTDNELKQLIEQLTDFQFILFMASIDIQMTQGLKDAFRFFTHENVTLTLNPPNIFVGPIEEKRVLSETQFYDLQRILRRMYFIEIESDEIIIYPDDSPQVKKLKMQMRINREKVRRAKAKKQRQEGSDMKLSDLIGSMTINDCGLNMINIWDLTYYAFHDQLKRMGWRDQFNINQKAALAGAKINKSQLKHWMRSIASSDK